VSFAWFLSSRKEGGKHQRKISGKISGKINQQHPIATQHLLYEDSYKLGEM